MSNAGNWSRHSNTSDRFISQFHDNLVKVTFNHFKKQNEEFKRKVQDQKDYNEKVKTKIQLGKQETSNLKKELEKVKSLNDSRKEDYEKIVHIIKSELDEKKNKLQAITLKVELKESTRRELEVESDRQKNKLVVEIQKLGVTENKVELLEIKQQGYEENIKMAKDEFHKTKRILESLKCRLESVSRERKEAEMKCVMAKEFGKNIIDIHEELILNIELANKERQSLLHSKTLHEKTNAKLVNIIIMNNILHDPRGLRAMMNRLDKLDTEYCAKTNKVKKITCLEFTDTELDTLHSVPSMKFSETASDTQYKEKPDGINNQEAKKYYTEVLENTIEQPKRKPSTPTGQETQRSGPEGGDNCQVDDSITSEFDIIPFSSESTPGDRVRKKIREGRNYAKNDVLLIYRNNIKGDDDDSTYD